jgi:hypothetical protein
MRILFRIAMVLLLTVGARADSFNFSFVSHDFTVSGILDGHLLSPGVYQITGMTGTIEPGKEPPLNELNFLPPGEFNNADNLLFVSEPYVDSFGINFFTGSVIIYALVHDQIGYALLACSNSSCSDSTRIGGELEVSSTVPEPSSVLLMVSGIVLLGMQVRRIASDRFA